jgi:hypothetical protein
MDIDIDIDIDIGIDIDLDMDMDMDTDMDIDIDAHIIKQFICARMLSVYHTSWLLAVPQKCPSLKGWYPRYRPCRSRPQPKQITEALPMMTMILKKTRMTKR